MSANTVMQLPLKPPKQRRVTLTRQEEDKAKRFLQEWAGREVLSAMPIKDICRIVGDHLGREIRSERTIRDLADLAEVKLKPKRELVKSDQEAKPELADLQGQIDAATKELASIRKELEAARALWADTLRHVDEASACLGAARALARANVL